MLTVSSFKYKLWRFSRFFQKKRMAECGHEFLKKDEILVNGNLVITKVPIDKYGSTPYCHKCLGEMATSCTYCGKPIFIGDQIVVEYPNSERKKGDYQIRIGCRRKNCPSVYSNGSFAFWVPPGRIDRMGFNH